MTHISLYTLLLVFSTYVLAACGGPPTKNPSTQAGTEPSTQAPESAATTSADDSTPLSGNVEDGVRVLSVTPVGDEMKFEQTTLTVEAGESVRIVFTNSATSPAMQHNVVVVTGPDVINRVGQAALGAASSGYVPEDEAILAATALAAPGETVEVAFTAPDTPGEYAYICTFPGHYMMMQGTLRVVAPSNA